jgi:endoglucanase
VYREYTQSFADCVTTDVHGNVAAVLNPDAAMKVMLAGHMDEIGFIIHHISDEGLLYFKGIGGMTASSRSAKGCGSTAGSA